jgi:hypothetical protein
MLYHSINNGGCGFLLLWFLFVRKFFLNKTGSSCCNIIHEPGSCHFDMTHFCYYCKTTFVLFEEVIKHSTKKHGSLMLKVKYLELNPFSGHYDDVTHSWKCCITVSKMVAVDFCCFGSCLFVIFFGTKPGHHAVTSFTKPGPAILT